MVVPAPLLHAAGFLPLAGLLLSCSPRAVPEPASPAVEAPSSPGDEAAPPATPIADRYRDDAARILEAALRDRGAWDKLSYLTDRIGHRLSGSDSLDRAVKWAVEILASEGHEEVRLDPVMVPRWVRGEEEAALVSPVARPLTILGLGNTVATPEQGVTAEVLVVDSFDALERAGARVKGKIVLFDVPMPPYSEERGSGYGEVVPYRSNGPSRAARLGASSVLVRSLTARSLRSAHTGALRYDEDAPKIPAAAVSTEDADLIARLAASGEPVVATLRLGARTLPDVESANVVAELRGREIPEELVLIGAHIDSWDVGQGAHDDGAGCAIVMQALTLLRQLDLRPRRTIRLVLFTNEENGLRGATSYAERHADEIPRHVMAMEADSGGFAPRGVRVQGSALALEQARDLVTLLEALGASRAEPGYAGADLIPLMEAGVAGLGHWVDGSHYFDYHHSHADTLDKVDPDELQRNVGLVAVVAYVVADMEERFGSDPAARAPEGGRR